MRIGLFAGDNYYPERGLGNWLGFFPTMESARSAGTTKTDDRSCCLHDWYQIVDTDTMTALETGQNNR